MNNLFETLDTNSQDLLNCVLDAHYYDEACNEDMQAFCKAEAIREYEIDSMYAEHFGLDVDTFRQYVDLDIITCEMMDRAFDTISNVPRHDDYIDPFDAEARHDAGIDIHQANVDMNSDLPF
jgi:hypothetical protein